MDKFINPESVAVIGVSADPHRLGYSVFSNLKDSFSGRFYPVNPKYDRVDGLPCWPDLASLPETPDLAIVIVPAAAAPAVLEECGRKGITRVQIQSAGFSEVGPAGRAIQDRCDEVAARYGLRIWGPNCMGMVNGQTGLVASFMRPDIWRDKLKPGNVSLIVQSGMLAAGFLMQVLSDGYFGLRVACSIGNRAGVTECDLLEYLVDDPLTEAVGLYLESVADVPRFREAVSRLGRPVVLLKGGTSAEGAKAARSHTASLAGNAELAEGFFRQLGLIRAHDFVEMMDLLKALVLWRGRKGGRRIAIITGSGAAGIVASDHLSRQGMTLADLSPATVEALKTVYPPWMGPENPLDLFPALGHSGPITVYQTVFKALLEDPGVDGIFMQTFVDARIVKHARKFMDILQNSSKPVVIWPMGDAAWFKPFRDEVEGLGLPAYPEISRCISALRLMVG
ncbi:MAG: CoA-binding protein [Proteobacteria bacterium]|nr:CoA-binding protein [Pseudomonadota bacterium]